VPGELGGLVVVLLGDAEREHGVPHELVAEAEEVPGEGIAVEDVAEPVADDDRHLHLAEHRLRRQQRLEGRFPPTLHMAVTLPSITRRDITDTARASPVLNDGPAVRIRDNDISARRFSIEKGGAKGRFSALRDEHVFGDMTG
jgi:hypothetical protein